MKKILTLILLAISTISVIAQTYVQPHYRKDGTFVEGYYRSEPNNTKLDNYSTQGNTNPYTGQAGTVDPYKQPEPQYGQTCHYTQSGNYVCR